MRDDVRPCETLILMMLLTVLCAMAIRQDVLPPIYFVRKDTIYKSEKGHETVVLRHAVSPTPSPDGKWLAFVRDGDLYLYDFTSQLSKRCSHLGDVPADAPEHDLFPSWDPQSQYVIFSHPDTYGVTQRGDVIPPLFGTEHGTRTIWNVYWCWVSKVGVKPDLSLFLGNETSGPSSFSAQSSMAAAFSPDGKRVAFCRNGDLWMATLEPSSIHDAIAEASWDEARVLACGTQEGGTRATNETNWIFRISWSPDGKLLALSSDRYSPTGGLQVLIVRADDPTEKVSSFPGADACFIDSSHLLYVKPYTHSVDIWLHDVETKDERILVSKAAEPAVGR